MPFPSPNTGELVKGAEKSFCVLKQLLTSLLLVFNVVGVWCNPKPRL